MEDSINSGEYILLSKSEYIEAKNFPTQVTCKTPKPDQIQGNEILTPYQSFSIFMNRKTKEESRSYRNPQNPTYYNHQQPFKTLKKPKNYQDINFMSQRIVDLELYIQELVEENKQIRDNKKQVNEIQNSTQNSQGFDNEFMQKISLPRKDFIKQDNQQNDFMEQRILDLELEVKELGDENQIMLKNINQHKHEQESIYEKYKSQQKQYITLQNRYTKIKNQNMHLKQKVDSKKHQQRLQRSSNKKDKSQVPLLENKIRQMEKDQDRLMQELNFQNSKMHEVEMQYSKTLENQKQEIEALQRRFAPTRQNEDLLKEENEIMNQKIISLDKIKINLEMQIQKLQENQHNRGKDSLFVSQMETEIIGLKKQIELEQQNKLKWKELVLLKEQELNDFTNNQIRELNELGPKFKQQKKKIQELLEINHIKNQENQVLSQKNNEILQQLENVSSEKEALKQQKQLLQIKIKEIEQFKYLNKNIEVEPQELEHLKQFKLKYEELQIQTSNKINEVILKSKLLEKENQDLKKQQETHDHQIINFKYEAQQIKEQNKLLLNQKEVYEEEKKQFDQNHLQQTQKDLQQLKMFFQQEKTMLQEQIKQIQEQMQTMKKQKIDQDKKLQNKQQKIEELNIKCEYLSKKLSLDLDQLKDEMDNELKSQLQKQVTSYKEEKNVYDKLIKNLEHSVKFSDQKYKQAKDKLNTFEQIISKKDTIIKQLSQDNESNKFILQEMKIKNNDMRKSQSQTQFVEENLEQQLKEVWGKRQEFEMRFVLMAFENERLANFHNQMIDEVEHWKQKCDQAEQKLMREKLTFTKNYQELQTQKKLLSARLVATPETSDYNNLKRKTILLENKLYKIQQDIEHEKNKYKALLDQNEILKKEKMEYQRQYEDLELTNHQLKSTCNDLTRLNNQILNQIETVKQQTGQLDSEKEIIISENTQLRNEIETIRNKLRDIQFRAQNHTDQTNNLNEEIMKQTRQIVTLQNKLAQQNAENLDQIKDIKNKKEIIEHLQTKNKQLQITHGQELELLRSQFDEFKKKSFDSRNSDIQHQAEKASLETKIQMYQQKIQELNNTITNLKTSNQLLKTNLNLSAQKDEYYHQQQQYGNETTDHVFKILIIFIQQGIFEIEMKYKSEIQQMSAQMQQLKSVNDNLHSELQNLYKMLEVRNSQKKNKLVDEIVTEKEIQLFENNKLNNVISIKEKIPNSSYNQLFTPEKQFRDQNELFKNQLNLINSSSKNQRSQQFTPSRCLKQDQ